MSCSVQCQLIHHGLHVDYTGIEPGLLNTAIKPDFCRQVQKCSPVVTKAHAVLEPECSLYRSLCISVDIFTTPVTCKSNLISSSMTGRESLHFFSVLIFAYHVLSLLSCLKHFFLYADVYPQHQGHRINCQASKGLISPKTTTK